MSRSARCWSGVPSREGATAAAAGGVFSVVVLVVEACGSMTVTGLLGGERWYEFEFLRIPRSDRLVLRIVERIGGRSRERTLGALGVRAVERWG